MNCLDCKHAALRDQRNQDRDKTLKRMARLGMLNCTKSYYQASFKRWDQEHDCPQHSKTDQEAADKRRAYFDPSKK
jgi:hypothetical protein